MSGLFKENKTVSRVAARKTAVFISLWLVAVLFLSCGGSGGSGGAGGGSGPAIFPPVVFMADKDNNGTIELYASFNDGEKIIKLSGTMVFGGNVVDFKVSPDGIWVAYVANQDRNDLFELYVVPVDKADDESPVKVSVALSPPGIKERFLGSGAFLFDWAPDSSLVAYIADADDFIADLFELFSSSPDGQEQYLISQLVNAASDVFDFKWAPDSALIAYVADQDAVGELALYVAPSDAEDASVPVSGAMAGNGIKEDPVGSGVYAFAWAPGGCAEVPNNFCLAYIADQFLQDKFELFTVIPDGSVTPRQISGPFGPNQDVVEFAWAPNSQLLAYTANQDNPLSVSLFTRPPDNSAISQINGIVGNGRKVSAFKWAPDSSLIAFLADKGITPDIFRLWTVSPDNNGAIEVSGGITLSTAEVTQFEWSPVMWRSPVTGLESFLIAYLVDAQEVELYTTFPSSGSSTQIGDLPQFFDGDVFDFEWAPDSSRIAYTADHDEAGVIELFTSTPDNDVTQISGTLESGGDVGAFKWTPDSSGVGYIADQNINNVDELFASQPNGSDNSNLSGQLVNGGDVARFEWVP